MAGKTTERECGGDQAPPGRDTDPSTSPDQPCRRCGGPGPLDDDGFCLRCEKDLEQACL